jgi:hypothetical protein
MRSCKHRMTENHSNDSILVSNSAAVNQGRYMYRSGMPEQEKPPMSRLPVTSLEISWRLPLDFQWCHCKSKASLWKSHKYWHRWFFLLGYIKPILTYSSLRPILNLAPRDKLWPQGRSCPKGWSYPLGVKLSAHPSILLNSREGSPLGVNKGVNISHRGQISSLGVKFTPGGQGWS